MDKPPAVVDGAEGYAGLGLSPRKLNRPSFYKGDKEPVRL